MTQDKFSRAFAEELLDAGALVCLSDVNQQVEMKSMRYKSNLCMYNLKCL